MNIQQVFKLGKVDGDIGVEIEIEGGNLPKRNVPFPWTYKADGSLRGAPEALEYLLVAPVKMNELEDCLKKLKNAFKQSIVVDSIYAGVHVHINAQELTAKQVITYLCSYIILEDLLINWCEETRRGNHFCLRTCDASYLLDFIRKMVENESLAALKRNDNIRYASVNLQSLGTFGSLEFRALESTLDISKILMWCKILFNIKKESLRYRNPVDLITSISKIGAIEFLRGMLGEYRYQFMGDGWQKKIREGIVKAQDIAYAKNWDMMSYNIFKVAKGGF